MNREHNGICRKHAYLIIAHCDDLTFYTLLRMIDNSENDIFIHMDKKNKKYDIDKAEKNVRVSGIFHVQRTNVSWGAYSQINAELLLLEKAVSCGPYQYYHLISGQDLPIKPQKYIHNFFEENYNKEFVEFGLFSAVHEDRFRLYHSFQQLIGRKKNPLLRIGNKMYLSMQKLIGVNRNEDIDFKKGASWFSITDSLARYVISQKDWIHNKFSTTRCCDEVFLQILVWSSDFKGKIYSNKKDGRAIMRLIDWKRGKPYTYTMSDWNEIVNSDMIFARKFSPQTDIEIIKKIENTFKDK